LSKISWIGIGAMISSLITLLTADLYSFAKASVQLQSIPFHMIIPTTLAAIGLGLVVYDILHRRQRSQQRKQKEDEEDKWKYFPSNVP
jgi:hypothetical protein